MEAKRPLQLNPVTCAEAWTGVADCLNCNIRQSALFAGLEERDFDDLHGPVDQLNYPVGAPIYRAGGDGVSLFTVRTGLVKLSHYLPDGGQRIVRLLRSTDVLGLECLLSTSYQHTAIWARSLIARAPAPCSPSRKPSSPGSASMTIWRRPCSTWTCARREKTTSSISSGPLTTMASA